ncbi:class F sortase [Arthrobacter sp. SX1312]|uniref:class F sortase n=1 Tax=Arthrobacter sp. SX1312 TaxID=2058896 RepID=UPI0021576E6E|nr:class F sortase [Arthrobacter sp. SX1312]
MHPRRSATAAAVLASILLVGCAQADDPADPAPAITAPVPTRSAPAGAAAAPVPDPAPASDTAVPPTAITDVPVQPADGALRPQDPAPVSLVVAGTDISVKVVDVGIEENDAMEIPDSFYEAGWYRYGPAPGAEAGNAVIAAHVDSLTEVMPFAQLKDVAIGTTVTVGLEDGRSLTYAVSDVRNVPKATLDGSEIFDRDGGHELKIITCGGEWLPEEGDYEDNVVLTALPL